MKPFGKIAAKAGKTLTKIRNANGTPKVMLISGVGLVVGSGIFACVKTMKLEERVDEMKENIDHVKELKEAGEYVVDVDTQETAEYTPKLYRKDLTYAYGQGIWSIAKLY